MRTLFEQFFVAPMPVLWVLLGGLLLWRWQRTSRALFAVGTVLFLLACVPVVGKLLMWGLASGAPSLDMTDDRRFAAIVVPTAGSFVDGAGRWWPGANSIRRVVAGRELQKRLGIPLVIAGGSPRANQPPEAATVAAMLGLDGPAVLLETTARNSSESGAAVAGLLLGKSPLRVVLVTNASHVARMSASMRHHGIEVVAAPVERQPHRFAPDTWEAADLIPSDNGLKLTRRALWEYTGILWYLITGRLDFSDLWQPAG